MPYFRTSERSAASRTRDLLELVLGYGLIIGIIWSPESALQPF